MAATSGRVRGRQSARSGAQGPAAEHRSKIIAVLATGVIVIVLVLGMTSQGHDIDAAVQRFMLYYAGVFALIGLTASVGVGLVATDRIIMTPGHRVMAQAVHRAVSFGALAFLLIHIVTEILAQRVHVIDSVVPFLSPYRTFYIGLGTIASDLIVLLVITGIVRKRFTAHGKAWRWRAIHYSAYASFVFGIMHGLLGGRAGKPYVDWSYGAAIALTAFGIGVRYLAISLRPKETLSAPPSGGKGSGPLHSATMAMAQAQLGGTIQMLPAATAAGAMGGAMGALAGEGAMGLPGTPLMQLPAGSSYGAYGGYGDSGYGNVGFTPLGAPPYGDSYNDAVPYQGAALASLPAPSRETRQPLYEPGYVGPPRYEGAPRTATGPMPRTATGPMPRVDSGPMPRLGSGPMPRVGTGPMPAIGTNPNPRSDHSQRSDSNLRSGPNPRPGASTPARGGTGPLPRADTGPMPRVGTGPMPRYGSDPAPRGRTGPMPRAGSMPYPPTGPNPTGPNPPSGPNPRSGPMPQSAGPPITSTGPMPRAGTGPIPRGDNGETGPVPRSGKPPANGRRGPGGQAENERRDRRGGGTWR